MNMYAPNAVMRLNILQGLCKTMQKNAPHAAQPSHARRSHRFRRVFHPLLRRLATVAAQVRLARLSARAAVAVVAEDKNNR